MNSVGVGAFFNLTNFGQMYSYHVLLLPAARWWRSSIAHVLLVRRHGVVPPFELDKSSAVLTERPEAARSRVRHAASYVVTRRRWSTTRGARAEWKGGYRHYDLVKEVVIAIGVVLAPGGPPDRPLLLA